LVANSTKREDEDERRSEEASEEGKEGGRNLLGIALMTVRARLRNEDLEVQG
jgi:predicted NAD-dependent protein-ADP-ribosyltransferase YbiA (DUF1768 family)